MQFKPSYRNLTSLQDVLVASPTNGQVLKYDTASGKWVNGDGGSGGTVDVTTDLVSSGNYPGLVVDTGDGGVEVMTYSAAAAILGTTNASNLTSGTLSASLLPSSIQTQITANASSISSLTTTVSGHTSSIGTLNTNVTSLQSSVTNASNLTSGTLAVARLPTGIPTTSIGGGTTTNTELGYVHGVTSAIQTQFLNVNNSINGISIGLDTVTGIASGAATNASTALSELAGLGDMAYQSSGGITVGNVTVTDGGTIHLSAYSNGSDTISIFNYDFAGYAFNVTDSGDVYAAGGLSVGAISTLGDVAIGGSLDAGAVSSYAATHYNLNAFNLLSYSGSTQTAVNVLSPLSFAGASLTGATSGVPQISVTQTWNTSGNPTLIKANVTNTASGSSSKLMDLQVGGVSRFNVDPTAAVNINSTTVGPMLTISTSVTATPKQFLATSSGGAIWAIWHGTESIPYFYIGGNASTSQYFWRANWTATTDPANTFKSASDYNLQVVMACKGAPSQSGDLFQAQNSSGTPLAKIDSSGNISSTGTVKGTNIGAEWVFSVSGGGSAIVAASADKVLFQAQFNYTITGWSIGADASGSIQFDIKTGSTVGGLTSVVASAPPALSSAQIGSSTTLTGWTAAVTAGQWVQVSVTSATTVKKADLVLKVVK